MCGWYSNIMRGDRKKQEERKKEKRVDENEIIEDSKIIDFRNYKPKRIPQLMWRGCIKKVWEIDPLACPKYTGEMRIISFIYKKAVIKKILIHLNIFEEKKNQRAPPRFIPDAQTPEIVPYNDGWPGYYEPVFDF
jgi:hypothetical protein